MRIAIITSGLEPGRDGVGDYSRLLAGELARRGHACALLALNDRWAGAVLEGAEGENGARLLRLPEGASWAEKASLAGAFLAGFDPDWVSLQFVCYGFNRKGLVLGASGCLARLLRPYPVHLMLHELWVGHGVYWNAMLAPLGAVQRNRVLALVRRLRPRVIHTTNPHYRRLLAVRGVEAGILPLFGNVPVTSGAADGWVFDALAAAGIRIDRENRDRFRLFGLFGGIEPAWPASPLFRRLAALGGAEERKIVVASVGRTGMDEGAWRAWEAALPEIAFRRLGERPIADISAFLQTIDFGLTSHPVYLLGKSGSTAAMLEHGVPVIANWGDIEPEVPALDDDLAGLLIKADDRMEERLAAWVRRPAPGSRLPAVATRVVAALEDINPPA